MSKFKKNSWFSWSRGNFQTNLFFRFCRAVQLWKGLAEFFYAFLVYGLPQPVFMDLWLDMLYRIKGTEKYSSYCLRQTPQTRQKIPG